MDVEKRVALWLLETHPTAALPAMVGMQDAAIVSLMLDLTAAGAAGVVGALGPTRAAAVLGQMPTAAAQGVLARLSRPVAREVLRRLPEQRREVLLGALPEAVRHSMRRALATRDGSVGALMDTEVVALPADLRVTETLRHLKSLPGRSLDIVCVVDASLRLEGVVEIGSLLVEGASRRLRELMKTDFTAASVEAGLQSLLNHPGWTDGLCLPVVDSDGYLVGIIHRRVVQDTVARNGRAGRTPSAMTSAALGQLFRAGVGGFVGILAPDMIATPRPRRGEIVELL